MAFSDANTRRNVLIGAAVAGVGLGAYLVYRKRSKSSAKPEKPRISGDDLKLLGNDEFKHSRFDAAIELYTKALAKDPSEPHIIYSNRAVSFAKLGRFEEALADANKTLELKPDFARGFERQGQALTGLKRFEEAMDAFQKAAQLQPSKQNNKAFMEMVQEAALGLQEGRLKRNVAFVFLKPHAVTEAAKTLVTETLAANGIQVLTEGSLAGEEIDSKKLIDQHYYAIASKATILKPNQLNVPEDKFEAAFGLSWKDALATGRVLNALDACADLGITADELDGLWAKCKADKKLVKFGGGFYCGLIEGVEGKEKAYVFNGFFMTMRSKFTAPGSSIYYYVVEWDGDALSWEDFRGKVLGPTDPATAPETSLRGMILARWQELGLKSVPNTGDNGVHASASPFEGLAERMNWLSIPLNEDPFGHSLLARGLAREMIEEWTRDPQVNTGEGKGSLFDQLEDINTVPCLDKCEALAKLQ